MSSYHKRKAQQCLRNPQIREALEELLGGKIMPKQREADQPEEKPIVAALVPCYHHPQPRMQQAFIEMQRASQDTCLFYPGPPVSSSVIHWSRNWLIAGLIKTQKPWTHVLFIDDDIVPPPDALNRLLSHKKDIVAALCTRRMDPPIPNIRKFNPNTQQYEEIWSWAPGLMEVGAAGTGMMLISREALGKVKDAYCDCMYEQEMYQLSGERLREIQWARMKAFDENANGFWFRFLPCLAGTVEMGEDVGFCFMASRYCGLKIYCDTTVQPGHVGEYVYSISDFMPHQRLAILRSKAESQWQKPTDNKAIISVLLPTRDRADDVRDSTAALIANASCPENVEILVRVDDDDKAKYTLPQQCRILTGERHGYRNLHKYFNEMAAQAQGEWLMLWNDDAMMETQGWDDKIRNAGSGLQILNPSGELNVFPIVHRSVYELLGHLSLQAHTDTWLQEVGRATQIERYMPLQIAHTPTVSNYTETRPEYFSETMTLLRQADADKIAHALEAIPA